MRSAKTVLTARQQPQDSTLKVYLGHQFSSNALTEHRQQDHAALDSEFKL